MTETMPGKIPAIVDSICKIVTDTKSTDPKYIWANLIRLYPSLTDDSKCANCGAKMEVKEYTADILNSVLLLKMAVVVREHMRAGKPFTEANLVYTPDLPTSDAVRHRTTICQYLNYIKQPDSKRNTGYWVITNWGWKVLRGEPVPRTVKYFRKKLQSRSEETITLGETFKIHKDKVDKAVALRKEVEADYRADVRSYDPTEWAELAGFGEGRLL